MKQDFKKNVWIKIKGVQKSEENDDSTELFTQGSFYRKNNNYYISYEESETTGFAGCHTTLKIEGTDKISLIRHGASHSNLLIEKGRRNIGYYGTEFGELMIGVNAQKIQVDLDEHGGELSFSYSLDINAGYISDNEVYIQVSEEN